MTLFRTTILFLVTAFSWATTTSRTISHIALNDGWQTWLIVENAGFEDCPVSLTVYAESASTSDFMVPLQSNLQYRIETGTCGRVDVTGDNVTVKISYVHGISHGVAEFILDGAGESDPLHDDGALHFLLPHYLAPRLTWMGLALMNPSEQTADVTLEAFDAQGSCIAQTVTPLAGFTRLVGFVDTLFPGLDFREVARVRALGEVGLSGITLSGNGNAQLLFTPAQTKASSPRSLVLSHLATDGDVWENVVVVDNVGDTDVPVQLDLFAQGVKIGEETRQVAANSTTVVDLTAWADLNPDSGILPQCPADLFVRLSHLSRQSLGTAEFLLSEETSQELQFFFPEYARERISWMGLALLNASDEETFLILKGFREGHEVARRLIHLGARGKCVGTLSQLFPGADGIRRVMAIAGTPLAGLNLSGEGFERLLFTPAAPYLESRSFLDRLHALPGVTVSPADDLETFASCYRVDVAQPIDHDHPDGATFIQTMWLAHRTPDQPMVLSTGGYMLRANRANELTELLHANHLITPHRFFDGARPEDPDWRFMNIEQASRDLHRITSLFKELYRGKWVNTGGSKGGMTSIFHRRFFPHDVDATVAYVAPIILDLPDTRFEAFMNQQAGTAYCRDRLRQMQRRMLTYRVEMVDLLEAIAPQYGASYDSLGADVAFEYMVMEYPVAFWQYGANTCDAMPPADASAGDMMTHLLNTLGFLYSDGDLEVFSPFYYQAVTEFGYYGFMTDSFSDLLFAVPDPSWTTFVPSDAPPTVYQGEVMQDILSWVQSQGNEMIFIYGGNDPWTSCAVELTGSTNAISITEPGQNHGVRIFECAERDRVYAVLEDWLALDLEVDVSKLRHTVSFDPGFAPMGTWPE